MFWDTNGATADAAGGDTAPGVWDTGNTANWSTSNVGTAATTTWTAGDWAVFSAGSETRGTYTVTVNGTVDVGSIILADGHVTLSGGTLTNLATLIVSQFQTGHVASDITGSQSINLTATGATLTLSGNNTYTGNTTFTAGNLIFANRHAFYGGEIDATSAAKFSAAASTSLTFMVGDGANFSSADLTAIAAHTTFGDDVTIHLDTSNDSAGSIPIAANFADSNSGANVLNLSKIGNGILTLTGDNTYTGITTVSSGALSFADVNAFYGGVIDQTNAGQLTVAAGATAGFGVGGAAGFSSTDLSTITTHADFDATAFLGLDTTNVGGVYDYTHTSAMNFAKLGTGTMTLTGDNTGTGAIAVQAGTLNLGGGGAVSLATNTLIVDAELIFDHSNDLTYSGAVSGSGHLVKTGTSTVTLNGDFSFTGSAEVADGTLALANPVTFGGPVTVDGSSSTLQASSSVSDFADFNGYTLFQTQAGATGLTVRNGATVTGGQLGFDSADAATTALRVESGGKIDEVAFLTVGNNPDAVTRAEISGAGSSVTVAALSLIGAGGLGQITVSDGGTLDSPALLIGLDGIGQLTINDGGTVNTGAILLGADFIVPQPFTTGSIELNAGGVLRVHGETGEFPIPGIVSEVESASFTLAGGTLEVVTNNLSVAVSTTLGSDTASTVDVDPGLTATFNAVIGGGGGLTKTGAGTLTLNAANSYTGNTTINEGTLVLGADGVIASTTLIVGNDAIFDVSAVADFTVGEFQTLGGTGSIEGALTLGSGATLAPGNSPGTLTFSDGLTLEAGAILNFELGTVSDLIAVTGGTLTGPSSGSVMLNLADSGGFTAGIYTLFDYTSATLSDFDTTDFSLGTTIAGYDYSFNLTGTALQLIAVTSAVPEPATYAAILGALALSFVIYRKRHP
ncbi:MAG: autotransporter-associated beta strand repeat-containing protein [Opitutaceae bacterium]|nr:autotransporter-associated beta strand repeat-containing protein [Opitutaceae bacterium]